MTPETRAERDMKFTKLVHDLLEFLENNASDPIAGMEACAYLLGAAVAQKTLKYEALADRIKTAAAECEERYRQNMAALLRMN